MSMALHYQYQDTVHKAYVVIDLEDLSLFLTGVALLWSFVVVFGRFWLFLVVFGSHCLHHMIVLTTF